MKAGKTVPIYDDMENKSGLIGFGKLITRTFKNSVVEMWIVENKFGVQKQYVFWAKNLKKIRRKRRF